MVVWEVGSYVGDASVPTPRPFHPRPYGYFPLQEWWCVKSES
jgi:hypothetical protein